MASSISVLLSLRFRAGLYDTTTYVPPVFPVPYVGVYGGFSSLRRDALTTVVAEVVVTRSGVADTTCSVSWEITPDLVDGMSADLFEGGVLPAGTITFTPGSQVQVVQVRLTPGPEPARELSGTFRLHTPVDCTIAPGQEGFRASVLSPQESSGALWDQPTWPAVLSYANSPNKVTLDDASELDALNNLAAGTTYVIDGTLDAAGATYTLAGLGTEAAPIRIRGLSDTPGSYATIKNAKVILKSRWLQVSRLNFENVEFVHAGDQYTDFRFNSYYGYPTGGLSAGVHYLDGTVAGSRYVNIQSNDFVDREGSILGRTILLAGAISPVDREDGWQNIWFQDNRVQGVSSPSGTTTNSQSKLIMMGVSIGDANNLAYLTVQRNLFKDNLVHPDAIVTRMAAIRIRDNTFERSGAALGSEQTIKVRYGSRKEHSGVYPTGPATRGFGVEISGNLWTAPSGSAYPVGSVFVRDGYHAIYNNWSVFLPSVGQPQDTSSVVPVGQSKIALAAGNMSWVWFPRNFDTAPSGGRALPAAAESKVAGNRIPVVVGDTSMDAFVATEPLFPAQGNVVAPASASRADRNFSVTLAATPAGAEVGTDQTTPVPGGSYALKPRRLYAVNSGILTGAPDPEVTTPSDPAILYVSPDGTGDGLSAGSPKAFSDAYGTVQAGATPGGAKLILLPGTYVAADNGLTLGRSFSGSNPLTLEAQYPAASVASNGTVSKEGTDANLVKILGTLNVQGSNQKLVGFAFPEAGKLIVSDAAGGTPKTGGVSVSRGQFVQTDAGYPSEIAGAAQALVTATGGNVILEGNTFEKPNNMLRGETAVRVRSSGLVTVKGNSLDGTWTKEAVAVGAGGNANIWNNWFVRAGQMCVHAGDEYDTPPADRSAVNVDISGNFFDAGGSIAAGVAGRTAVFVKNTSEGVIKGNTFDAGFDFPIDSNAINALDLNGLQGIGTVGLHPLALLIEANSFSGGAVKIRGRGRGSAEAVTIRDNTGSVASFTVGTLEPRGATGISAGAGWSTDAPSVTQNNNSFTITGLPTPSSPLDGLMPVRPVYSGTTYYVSPTGSGSGKTNREDPGALQATADAAPSGSTIVCLQSSSKYPGLSLTRSGVDLRFVADVPALTSIDVTPRSSVDRENIVSTAVTGLLGTRGCEIGANWTFRNMGKIWVEGFQGRYPSGRINITGCTEGWVSRCDMEGVEGYAISNDGGTGKFVIFQNLLRNLFTWQRSDPTGPYYSTEALNPDGSAITDYPIRCYGVDEFHFYGNLNWGKFNHFVSTKELAKLTLVKYNLFVLPPSGSSVGAAGPQFGQECDRGTTEYTCGRVEFHYNTVCLPGMRAIAVWNTSEADIQYNRFVGGATQVVHTFLNGGSIRDSQGAGTNVGPLHPKSIYFANNTMYSAGCTMQLYSRGRADDTLTLGANTVTGGPYRIVRYDYLSSQSAFRPLTGLPLINVVGHGGSSGFSAPTGDEASLDSILPDLYAYNGSVISANTGNAQSRINSAANGDIIVLAAGNYGSLTIPANRSIWVRGAVAPFTGLNCTPVFSTADEMTSATDHSPRDRRVTGLQSTSNLARGSIQVESGAANVRISNFYSGNAGGIRFLGSFNRACVHDVWLESIDSRGISVRQGTSTDYRGTAPEYVEFRTIIYADSRINGTGASSGGEYTDYGTIIHGTMNVYIEDTVRYGGFNHGISFKGGAGKTRGLINRCVFASWNQQNSNGNTNQLQLGQNIDNYSGSSLGNITCGPIAVSDCTFIGFNHGPNFRLSAISFQNAASLEAYGCVFGRFFNGGSSDGGILRMRRGDSFSTTPAGLPGSAPKAWSGEVYLHDNDIHTVRTFSPQRASDAGSDYENCTLRFANNTVAGGPIPISPNGHPVALGSNPGFST